MYSSLNVTAKHREMAQGQLICWSFCFPVSQTRHSWFLQICLHTGSLHAGMPVIPEFAVKS